MQLTLLKLSKRTLSCGEYDDPKENEMFLQTDLTGHSKLEYQGFSNNEPKSVFSQQILRVREVM